MCQHVLSCSAVRKIRLTSRHKAESHKVQSLFSDILWGFYEGFRLLVAYMIIITPYGAYV